MRKIVLYIVLCCCMQRTSGQILDSIVYKSKEYPLQNNEHLILKVKINKKLCRDKYECGQLKFKADLYNIEVQKLFYSACPLILDSAGVLKLQYIIAATKYADSLESGNVYYVTAAYTKNVKYIRLVRVLRINPAGYQFHQYMVFNPPKNCGTKRDAFGDFILEQ